jgi:hypothetical protein
MKKNLEDSGKSKNRRKVKLYYWGSGMNIFFLEYKDKNFFCCLQTFFITGLTFFTHLFHPDPEINYWVMQIQKKTKKNLVCTRNSKNRRKVKIYYWVIKFVITGRSSQKHSWGNHPVSNS